MTNAACTTVDNYDLLDQLQDAIHDLANGQSGITLRDIELTLFRITDRTVEAVVDQRLEVLSREMAKLNLAANDIRYLCQDYPDNSQLHIILGRIEQLIDVIDLADDTALPTSTINAIVDNSTYLQVLQAVHNSPENASSLAHLSELRPALEWLSQHRLIEVASSAITFGRKGQSAFREALEEIGIREGTTVT